MFANKGLMQKSMDLQLDELRELVQIFVTRRKVEAQRTVLVKIHNHFYTISSEVLNRVFLPIGNVDSIEILDQGAQFHSRIRFQDREAAVKAVERYDGRCIYDGCCLMELALEVPTNHPLSKIVAPVAYSTQEAVTSKIEHVKTDSFLDEYNMFDERSMRDWTKELQEVCSLDLTRCCASLNTETQRKNNVGACIEQETNDDSDKVFSPSLIQTVFETTEIILSCNLGRYTMVEKDSTKNQVSTAPANPTVLGTPNDADRLSRAGMAEGNSGNRILGGRWPEVVQEMELQKDETKSCSCSNPIAISCEQQLAELPPPNQLLSQFGVHLDAEAKSILQGKICEVLPSSEIGIGNVKFLELEFLESDGMKCGGLVRGCEKPDFHAFGVSLGSWNLDLHPPVVDGNVGSKAMEFRVMNQPFMNAHVMFEKMSVMEVGVGDESIKLLRTLQTVFGSIDTIGLFVFDPGKIFDMLLVLLWPIMSKCGPWLSLLFSVAHILG